METSPKRFLTTCILTRPGEQSRDHRYYFFAEDMAQAQGCYSGDEYTNVKIIEAPYTKRDKTLSFLRERRSATISFRTYHIFLAAILFVLGLLTIA